MNTLQVKLFGQQHTLKEPNIGELMNIEALRASYSFQNYEHMRESRPGTSAHNAFRIIEALTFFQTCVPTLKDLLGLRSYLDMQPTKAKEMVLVFQQQVKPWLEKMEDQWYVQEHDLNPESLVEAKNG